MFLDAYPVKFGEDLGSTVTDEDLIALGMKEDEMERFRRTSQVSHPHRILIILTQFSPHPHNPSPILTQSSPHLVSG